MTQSAWTQANLAAKRAAFPLCAPRAQTLAFWPVLVLAAAINAYHQAFFMVMTPTASPRTEAAKCR